MCSDSDLGPVTLQVRDQVLHRGHDPPLWLPQLGSPHRPAADLTSGKLLTSHVPPRGHVTLTHDTLAANTHEIKQRNGSKLMYLSFLCTCLIFVRCH